MQPEMENVGKGPPVTPVAAKVGLFSGHATPALANLGFTLPACHYSWAKLVMTNQTLVGFPSPNQLSCDDHPFFEGLHPLSSGAKAFTTMFSPLKGTLSRNFIYRGNFLKRDADFGGYS